MAKNLWLSIAAVLVFFIPVNAHAAAETTCEAFSVGAENSVCLAHDLVESDKRINAVYKVLMGSMDKDARLALRTEQRAWLKQRDKACKLDTKETNREKWLQKILKDEAQTICVVRFTFGRVGELNAMLEERAPAAAPKNLPPAPVSPVFAPAPTTILPTGLRAEQEGYGMRSLPTHNNGLWYYELEVDIGGIAEQGSLLMHAGFQIRGESRMFGTMISVRHTQKGKQPTYVGLAIDLNQGFVYIRRNGSWGNSPPGSSSGLTLRMNRDYQIWMAASAPLTDLIGAGMIKVNLGRKPFRYTMPDGYRPFAAR
jgi:uncharacterized protein YecT (DUF1311 family)